MLSGFSKPPWEFTEEDLQELVTLKTPEGLYLDYKRSELLHNKTNAVKKYQRSTTPMAGQ